MEGFRHTSVLLRETVQAIAVKPKGIYVDCTLGGGGHAAQIANLLDADGWLIGIDQNQAALTASKLRLSDLRCRLSIVKGNFSELNSILADLDITAIDGIVFDLGVSSYQLDTAERGFSYMQDGPLDMRMNPGQAFTAYELINKYSASELTGIIGEYGEERWAKRIADFIIKARQTAPIGSTARLVEIVKQAVPSAVRRKGPHPAKRTFQAIRIAVNNELGILQAAFTAAVDKLAFGGRICIITFHSLEDRIAKKTLQNMAKGCICPPQLPLCICNNSPKVKLLGKPILPGKDELSLNPRARSAKLRVAEKLS